MRSNRPLALKEILTDCRFWRLAPLSATCIGASWALQGLWAASWFADVERLDRAEVVRRLFFMALALCTAALALGLAADRFRRRGVPAQGLLIGAALISLAAQLTLILRWPLPPVLLWSIVAGMGAATVLSFATLAEEFPTESIGQANGALNVLHLVAAFIMQTGIGLIVQQWPSIEGRYPAAAYQVALATGLALQTAAVLWSVRPERARARDHSVMSSVAPALRDGQTVEPVTDFQRAAEVWDDRLGSAQAQAANWRLAAMGAIAFIGLLSVTFAVTVSRADAVVYRVDIGAPDKQGIVAASKTAQPLDPQIAYVLARFIENVRSLSTDPIIVRANWRDAYAHVTDRGAEVLNRYVRAGDPFAKIGARTVSVEVISIVRASDRTFAIRWVETTYEKGAHIAAGIFTGSLEIVLEPSPTAEALLVNPLGLYVHSVAWSRESLDRTKRRLTVAARCFTE